MRELERQAISNCALIPTGGINFNDLDGLIISDQICMKTVTSTSNKINFCSLMISLKLNGFEQEMSEIKQFQSNENILDKTCVQCTKTHEVSVTKQCIPTDKTHRVHNQTKLYMLIGKHFTNQIYPLEP